MTIETRQAVFIDEQGNEVRASDWQAQTTLLVFMRWLG